MSTKMDSVIKLAIVFFISLLSFSVGTFVGKKYSDNQHELSALEPQKGTHGTHREVASEGHGSEQHGAGAMTDEEIAKLAEEFVADEKAPAHGESANEHGDEVGNNEQHAEHGVVEPKHNNHHESESASHDSHEEPSSAAKNLAAGKNPVAENHEAKPTRRDERIPTSLPKNVAQYSVGKFTVQIASYADEAEAIKVATDLKGKGYSAFYVPANIRGKTWYRVSVGQFATQKEAVTYRSEFMNTSKIDTAIVQKITE